jgi:hypothetical protein
MKIILSVLIAIVLHSSCMPEVQEKNLAYQNIVILSDMSSRIRNLRFPQKDLSKIHEVTQLFISECVKPGEKIGDKSCISFSALSEKNAICIDLDKIKDIGEKQSFINSTNDYKNNGLINKLVNFEDTVKILYDNITNPGLDLISILIEKIENENILKYDKVDRNDINIINTHYENHIYIFTDGYLEYASSQKKINSQFYFGDSEIERVRNYCINNKVNINTAINEDSTLVLPICESAKNKYVNLHILETHERDKDIKFQTYTHDKGFRDNEILQAVWEKWAKESGFKSFEWKKY